MIRFEPKEEKLPEKTKVDCVMNRSAGKLWIDEEDGALAKIQYTLIEPAKFWLSLLGSVTEMEGELIYSRVDAGVRLPRSVAVDVTGRLLLSSLGQGICLRWSEYANHP